MEQRSPAGSSGGSESEYGIQRRGKARAKGMKQKRESSFGYAPETQVSLTNRDVADGTINKLRNLGKQRFALYPFSEYFDTWLRNVRQVLSEFETNPEIDPDDQFSTDILRILSDVESRLNERRRMEMSRIRAEENLSETKTILDRLEREFSEKAKKTETQGSEEVKRLSSVVSDLKEKLDGVDRMKTGIFRGFSEKAKAHRSAEVQRELDSAQRELDLAVRHSDAVRQELKEDYEWKRMPFLEKASVLEKELEEQEIDGSLRNRDDACEALVTAVNSLLERSASLKRSA